MKKKYIIPIIESIVVSPFGALMGNSPIDPSQTETNGKIGTLSVPKRVF
ncbi:MAG: hypothetical protein IJ718_01180 [Paludibacteraceae bacterium]|nr:hypothetical protein [Paludibacteraceae bacterium]